MPGEASRGPGPVPGVPVMLSPGTLGLPFLSQGITSTSPLPPEAASPKTVNVFCFQYAFQESSLIWRTWS